MHPQQSRNTLPVRLPDDYLLALVLFRQQKNKEWQIRLALVLEKARNQKHAVLFQAMVSKEFRAADFH